MKMAGVAALEPVTNLMFARGEPLRPHIELFRHDLIKAGIASKDANGSQGGVSFAPHTF
jgi:hypothetical protein